MYDSCSLGYLVGNYPDSWLLQRYPTGKVFAISECNQACSEPYIDLLLSNAHMGDHRHHVEHSSSIGTICGTDPGFTIHRTPACTNFASIMANR